MEIHEGIILAFKLKVFRCVGRIVVERRVEGLTDRTIKV